MTRRVACRNHRRLDLETLEVRTLLSTLSSTLVSGPFPADSPGVSGTTNFDAIVGASAARSQYHVDGTGSAVAVIDTGVNYQNEALGGGFGAGHKVVAGFDFANNSPDPMPSALDHGTSVAGLIASSDPAHLGVAPGADIVALRVFDNNNASNYTRVANALQWVIDHHNQYNITAVNLSLSDGGNYAQNWFANDGGVGQQITGLIGQLDALNIPVMTAAGNSFNGQQGEGFTGIISDTISVTATDASDHLVSNAQRLGTALGGVSATDIAAPGDSVIAPSGSNGFASVTGTSFSTPIVSGAVVLLQEVYKSRFNQLPTVAQLDGWLQQGADPITDSVTGITIGRLDIPRSIGLIPNLAAQVLLPPPAPTPPPAEAPAIPPVTVTPPVVTPPPVTVTPSAPVTPPATVTPSAPVTPPATVTPSAPVTPATPSTPQSAIWFGGKQVNNAGTFSSAPSWFSQFVNGLRGWWTAPKLGTSQPAGVVKTKLKLTTTAHPAASSIKVIHPVYHRGFVSGKHGR